MEKEHLLGKTLEELQTVAEENGLPRFAAKSYCGHVEPFVEASGVIVTAL